MYNIFKLGVKLSFILLLAVSCQSDIKNINEVKSMEVSVKFNVENSGTLLSPQNYAGKQSTQKKLYAVQVRSKLIGTGGELEPHSYGLYDQLTSLNLTIEENRECKIEVSAVFGAVFGAENVLYDNKGAYHEPFTVNSNPLKVTNKLIESKLDFFDGLTLGDSKIHITTTEPKVFTMPQFDRLYGSSTFTRTTIDEGNPINILLKHYVFALQPNIDPNLITGKMIISLPSTHYSLARSPDIVIDLAEPRNVNDNYYIFSFENMGLEEQVDVDIVLKYYTDIGQNGVYEDLTPKKTIIISNNSLKRLHKYKLPLFSYVSGESDSYVIESEELKFIDGGVLK